MSKLELFLQLEEEIKPYKKVMSDASDIIIAKEVSDYPIFVMHQQQVEIGIPIAELGKHKGSWSVHASSLEEFVSKQIVHQDKIEEFKKTYKNAEEHLCIFVLSELGTQFIYVAR